MLMYYRKLENFRSEIFRVINFQVKNFGCSLFNVLYYYTKIDMYKIFQSKELLDACSHPKKFNAKITVV